MIDLHTHILPGIDDGAGTVEEATSMLTMEWASGVNRIFLTPHFYPEETDLDTFLTEREKAWSLLKSSIDHEEQNRLRLGAEVRYCPQLLSLDLNCVTLEHTSFILLELPSQGRPAFMAQIMEKLLGDGIVPILAHVERCAYFREEPVLLKRLADMGVLAQVSAAGLFDKRDRNFSKACLQHRLAQIVASDAHNTNSRKPCMDLMKKLPEEIRQLHHVISNAVWDNEVTPYFKTTDIRKHFLNYR